MARTAEALHTEVAIVGGGLVGMAAAIALARLPIGDDGAADGDGPARAGARHDLPPRPALSGGERRPG